MVRALFLLSVALLVALLAAVSCQSLPPPAVCSDIPTNGCPVDRGGTCQDVTCAAIYECLNGAWILSQTCDNPLDGGAGGGGSGIDGGAGGGLSPDGGPCTMVTIDAGGATDDCMIDLMFPDCPYQAAEGCAQSACLTGCSDFYICMDGGWYDVAYCDDNGQVVVTQH